MLSREKTSRVLDAVTGVAPSPVDLDAATRVLRQFRVIFNTVKTHFQQIEKSAGIGGAQVWALSILKSSPNVGVGELARRMDIHPSTASNLVRALVDRELVTLRKSPDDGRAVQLRLTPVGTRTLKRAPAPLSGVLPEALASLDTGTLEHLEEMLNLLIATLGADGRARGTPLGT